MIFKKTFVCVWLIMSCNVVYPMFETFTTGICAVIVKTIAEMSIKAIFWKESPSLEALINESLKTQQAIIDSPFVDPSAKIIAHAQHALDQKKLRCFHIQTYFKEAQHTQNLSKEDEETMRWAEKELEECLNSLNSLHILKKRVNKRMVSIF